MDEIVLPEAVRRQKKAADEMIERLRREAEEANNDTTEGGEGDDTTQSDAGSDTLADGTVEDTVEPAGGADEPAGDDPLRTLQARYDSLKGKYDTELPAANQRIGKLEADIAGLRDYIAAQTKKPAEPAATAKPKSKHLTKEMQDRLADPELVEIFTAAARDAVADDFDALRAENNQLKQQLGTVGNTVKAATVSQFKVQLNDAIAGEATWEGMDEDREFLAWLDRPDRYSGQKKQSLLDEAVKALDVDRTAAFYNDYLAERDGTAAQPTVTKTTPAATAGTRKVRLETLAGPSTRAGTTTSSATRRGRVWTTTDIANYYRNKRAGYYSGERKAEGEKLELDIFEAQREGRVQQ